MEKIECNKDSIESVYGDSKAIGKVLGVTDRQVNNLAKQGLPFFDGKGNLVDCVQWYFKNRHNEKSEKYKLKKLEFEAKNLEVDFRKKENELIERKDSKEVVLESYVIVKQNVLSVGRRICQELAGEENAGVIEKVITEEIEEQFNSSAQQLLKLYEIEPNAKSKKNPTKKPDKKAKKE